MGFGALGSLAPKIWAIEEFYCRAFWTLRYCGICYHFSYGTLQIFLGPSEIHMLRATASWQKNVYEEPYIQNSWSNYKHVINKKISLLHLTSCVFAAGGHRNVLRHCWVAGDHRYGATLLCLRADSRLSPSQWETSLRSNAVSHWLGANLESDLCLQVQRGTGETGGVRKLHRGWNMYTY